MLEIDNTALEAITSAINEVISLIDAGKDIRIVTAMLPKVSNRIRAVAEIRDTPDNRFVAFLIEYYFRNIEMRFQGEEEEWYQLNRESIGECMLHLKSLLTDLKDSLGSKDFDKTISAIKMFNFAYYQTTLSIAS